MIINKLKCISIALCFAVAVWSEGQCMDDVIAPSQKGPTLTQIDSFGGDGGCPIGSIIMWGGLNNAPLNWLVCDGSLQDKSAYPLLEGIIHNNFGASPDAQHFYLPDLRGYFVRGVDDDANRDPDKAHRKNREGGTCGGIVGSRQEDEFRSHCHQYTKVGGDGNTCDGENWATQNVNTSHTGGNETRPVNVYLYYIIKAS